MTVTDEMVERAANAMIAGMFAPHELPLDAELYSKYLATAREALTAALSDQVVVPKEPDDRRLKPFGYAPGNYMSKCFSCDAPREGLDKLATSCRECAERRYKNLIAVIAAAPPRSSTAGGGE